MKRHPILQPLSREHHQALVLGRRVVAWADDANSALEDAWHAVSEAYGRELERHFQDEERDVLPAVAAAGRADLVERTRADHEVLRNLARARGDRAALRAFGERITAHVRFEERELFPAFERTLGDDPPEKP